VGKIAEGRKTGRHGGEVELAPLPQRERRLARVLAQLALGQPASEADVSALEAKAVTRIIIPGMVAGISGELEEELPGWQVLVGPREAIGIPSFLKQVANA